jgi:hypothetical protein
LKEEGLRITKSILVNEDFAVQVSLLVQFMMMVPKVSKIITRIREHSVRGLSEFMGSWAHGLIYRSQIGRLFEMAGRPLLYVSRKESSMVGKRHLEAGKENDVLAA